MNKLILIIALLTPCLVEAQAGEIKGVVTFFFNKYQGDKPDIGAEVMVTDSLSAHGYNQSIADSFYIGSINRSLYYGYKSMGGDVKMPKEIEDGVYQWGVETQGKYDSLATRAFKNLLVIKYSKNVQSTIVDGAGNYSLSVPPGVYYIVIQSNNRKGSTVYDVMGKMYAKKIVVVANQVTNVSNKFDLY
ncbi:hypothetical protein ACTJJB_30880 [Chitinophaga sp. 22536]|uniref:hypothetical protein n=1 Tax=unclassified Chitinophaga TaxID=2619133 RepID=UPI003F8398B2